MYPVRKEWSLEDENQLNEAISELDSLFVEAAESGNCSLPVERTVELAAMPPSVCEDVGELSRKRKKVEVGEEIGNDCESATAKESVKGQPWTVEEHELFLRGLQKYGRGKWRMVCWEFLKTRTPIQVASHAQKYFNRPKIPSKKRRSSIHDIRLPNTSAVENTGIVATPLSKHEIFTITNSNVFDRHVPNPNICTELPTMPSWGHQQLFNPSIQYSSMFDFDDGV